MKVFNEGPPASAVSGLTGAVLALLAVLVAVSTPGCGQSPPLRVAAHVWPGYELMFIARELQWLDPAQVELVPKSYAGESLEALAAGQVDAAALTLDEVLAARHRGVPLTVVLVFNVSAGADVVIARPGVDMSNGLKGMRIGYERGAVGALMLEKALREAGLGFDDIVPVNLPPSRHLTAWEIGLVDALVTYEPLSSHLRAQGGAVLFDSSQAPNRIVDVLAVRTDRLQGSRKQALRHLVAAHFRALEHFQRNPQDAAYRMVPRLRLPAAEVSGTFRGLVLPDAANNHRLLSGEAAPLLSSASELAMLMSSWDLLPTSRVDLAGLVDDRFLPALERQ